MSVQTPSSPAPRPSPPPMKNRAKERLLSLVAANPPIDVILAALYLLVVDYPTRLKISSSNSLSALLTVAIPAMLIAVYITNRIAASLAPSRLMRAYLHSSTQVPLLLKLFAIYALIRLAMSPTSEAVQNVMCYLIYILGMLVAVGSLRINYSRALRWMGMCAVGGCVLYLYQQIFAYTGQDGERPYISDRAIAMTCLIGLAVLVPVSARLRDRDLPPARLIWPLFVFATLVASLSRTATAIGALLMVFLAVRVKGRGRMFAVVGAIVAILLGMGFVLATQPEIIQRFTQGDNASVGGVSINTSGRSELWRITWESAIQSPIFGHGPGDARRVIQEGFAIPNTDHPHNDYLRIFNDFGLVGVVMLWGGTLQLLIRCIRRARRLDEPRHWAAMMALLSVCIIGITDNVIVYPFVMLPVGALVGLSLRERATAVPELEATHPPR